MVLPALVQWKMDGLLSEAGLPVLVSQGNPSTFLQNLNLLPKSGEQSKKAKAL